MMKPCYHRGMHLLLLLLFTTIILMSGSAGKPKPQETRHDPSRLLTNHLTNQHRCPTLTAALREAWEPLRASRYQVEAKRDTTSSG